MDRIATLHQLWLIWGVNCMANRTQRICVDGTAMTWFISTTSFLNFFIILFQGKIQFFVELWALLELKKWKQSGLECQLFLILSGWSRFQIPAREEIISTLQFGMVDLPMVTHIDGYFLTINNNVLERVAPFIWLGRRTTYIVTAESTKCSLFQTTREL